MEADSRQLLMYGVDCWRNALTHRDIHRCQSLIGAWWHALTTIAPSYSLRPHSTRQLSMYLRLPWARPSYTYVRRISMPQPSKSPQQTGKIFISFAPRLPSLYPSRTVFAPLTQPTSAVHSRASAAKVNKSVSFIG